jgi:hypothetical protein
MSTPAFIEYLPTTKYKPTDLPELIRGLFQRWTHIATVTYPERCGLCGTPTAGNWFTGYYLPCMGKHVAEQEYGPRF